MTFQPVLSEKLKKVLEKLSTRDKVLAVAINKKIKQICSCNEEVIDYYKNLRYDLSGYKRVHVERSFVLLFKVDFEKKRVLFVDIDHHDNIYKR